MASSSIPPADALKMSKVIAVVGASKSPEKEAHTVPAYLKSHGYRIIPINPTAPEILGEKAYPTLLDMPESHANRVDTVEVFRPSDELPQVARQVVEMKKRYGTPSIFWAQLGLENDEAKRILEEAGISYVMDACMRVVHQQMMRARGMKT